MDGWELIPSHQVAVTLYEGRFAAQQRAGGFGEGEGAVAFVIDGQRVRQTDLVPGSRIEIGSTRMSITSPGSDV